MPGTTDTGTGARIATNRRLRGMTQVQLANKANVSYSLLTKVEAGIKPASAALTAACARAMDMPVTALNGQPFSVEHFHDNLDGPLAELRAALDNWDMPLEEVPVRTMSEIRADIDRLVKVRRGASFGQIAQWAPALINELVQFSQTLTGEHARRAHHMLVQVYRSAHDVAYGLGLTDLASLLMTRMDYSASRSGDLFLMSLYRYMRAQSTFSTGRHEVGRKIIDIARDEIAAEVAAGHPAALCAAGNLNLRAAILSTRQGDGPAAREALKEARKLAEMLGDVEVEGGLADGHHLMSFGPTNVAIHASAVELELGQHGKALALAKKVTFPEGFPPDRVGHHWIDTARAQLWTGKTDDALASLMRAKKAAPQQAKYHPSVRETVAGLVRAARSTPDTLIGYAHWVGVQP
ncbi:helix-turn-helix transcriptional regulator [Streptomyces sp. NPDC049597]|uniref:helix-turn-helix domain-containing protein n=1 Tax=Streptomyces sp. NPDC049597 TaxID=3155276 RepID=UPI003431AF56